MVDTLHPADAVSGAPSYTGRKLRQTRSALHAGATPTRPLGARSGVRPGTPSTTVTATSTTWTVQPFAGVADAEAAAEAGPYTFAFDAVATGSVTAAAVGQTRIDLIVVQVDDPAESDGTSVPAVRRLYVAGTPGSPGVAPATPARSFVIAQINVPASGGGSPTVTWVAPYAVAAGGVLPVSSGVRPANPYVGQYIDDAVLGLLRYDGASWVSLTVDSGWINPTLVNSWVVDSGFTVSYRKINGIVYLRGRMMSGTTGTAFTLPAGFRPSQLSIFSAIDNVGATATARLLVLANGDVQAVSGQRPNIDTIRFPADA